MNSFSKGVLSTQWTVFLDVDANKARVDAAQELVSVAHDDGAYVVQMSTQSIYWNISSPTPLTMLCSTRKATFGWPFCWQATC